MSIKKNFTYNLIYQLLLFIMPLITTPYVSRVIGVNGVGIYSYTYSVAYYFVLLAMLGINNYGTRAIARVRDDKQRLNEEFSSIYIMQLIIAILSLTIYLLFVLKTSGQYRSIAIVQAIYVASAILDVNWLFFGLEKIKLIVVRNAIIKISTTCSIFLLVKSESDLIIYTLVLALGTFLSQTILWSFVRRNIRFVKPSFNQIVIHLKPNIIMFIPVIAISIYRYMSKIMISLMSDTFQTGLYESADKIVTLPLAIMVALGTVMMPKMSNMVALGNKENEKRYIRDSMQFVIVISMAVVFGFLSISGRFSIIYFGEEFSTTGKLISILAPIFLFSSWASIIRTQYLIPNRQDKRYVTSVILGAAVNLTINGVLVSRYGAYGAAIGTIGAEFTVAAYQTFIVRKELDFKTYILDGIMFLVAGIIMFIVVSASNNIIVNSIIGLILQIIIGAITYIVSSLSLYYIWDKERFNYLSDLSGVNKIIGKVNSKVIKFVSK